MTHIFISYSRSDYDRVKPIVDLIKEQGWSVYWDQDLRRGDFFPHVLDSKLAAAYLVIVFWTKDSVQSEWVYEEAERAKNYRTFLPVKLDMVNPHSVLPDVKRSTSRHRRNSAGINLLLSCYLPFALSEPIKVSPNQNPLPRLLVKIDLKMVHVHLP